MGDENPIRTLGDYSKPSHEGYRNTIELPAGNNVVPLRSDTIRLVQNGCSFHELQSEDPNQHLKDFLKLVDSLDLDGENKCPHNTPILHENPEQSSVEIRSYRERVKRRSQMTNKIDTMLKAITDRIASMLPSDTVKNSKLGEKERSNKGTPDNTEKPTKTEAEMPVKEAETKNGAEDGAGNNSIKTHENEEAVEAPRTRAREKKGKTYKVLPRGPVYDAILKKKITKKEDIERNFEIPSSHSYIYPLGIAEDVLVEVAEHVYPIDFMILDIRENEKRPFILGTPFLTTATTTIRLYLMRRSLEVLRKFHWMILGGRFNQLSHVSSPLLSKPGEY
ncbi:hypothetical protein Tco_1044468 [Tanacetum coccineum]|uniref:MAK10-like protein n=1 Tax=Tanacetum coccineum TaxID=301880 RepID=A0ABQ5GQ13_9ASTR